MDLPLDATECRIVGCLLEKEMATPDVYPMTLNALQSACNQKSNRDPVTSYEEFEIEGALRSLVVKGWVSNSNASGRAIKWMHRVKERMGLEDAERAVIAELLLRGPQQPGELRAHAARLCPSALATPEALAAVLDRLAAMSPPLVRNLGRRAGERADRHGHLIGGEITAAPSAPLPAARPPAPASSAEPGLVERITALEQEVAVLREFVEAFRRSS